MREEHAFDVFPRRQSDGNEWAVNFSRIIRYPITYVETQGSRLRVAILLFGNFRVRLNKVEFDDVIIDKKIKMERMEDWKLSERSFCAFP